MASSYVQTLRTKREEVLADIRRLRAEMSDLGAKMASKENQLKNIEDLLNLEGELPQSSGDHLQETGQSGSKFIEVAYRLLGDAGKPMHYRELADLLVREGAYVPGQDPAANLLAHMSRDERFGRTRSRGVYGLAEWPAVRAARRAAAPKRRTTRRRARQA